MSTRAEIIAAFTSVARDHDKALAPLTDDLPLLDSGIDSLCMAVIVTTLEVELGVDPFSAAAEVDVPATFGEFVALYEHALQHAVH